jgi:hypothetical protein
MSFPPYTTISHVGKEENKDEEDKEDKEDEEDKETRTRSTRRTRRTRRQGLGVQGGRGVRGDGGRGDKNPEYSRLHTISLDDFHNPGFQKFRVGIFYIIVSPSNEFWESLEAYHRSIRLYLSMSGRSERRARGQEGAREGKRREAAQAGRRREGGGEGRGKLGRR